MAPRKGRTDSTGRRAGQASRHGEIPSPGLAQNRRKALVALGVGGLVALALVLVVVSVQRSANDGTASPGASAGSSGAGSSGQRITRLRLTSLDGKPVSLPAGRPGMIMFSGTGCTTDIDSARDMARFQSQTRRRVDAAYISVDPAETPGTLAVRRTDIGNTPYPFAIDTSGTLAADNQITALGTVLIYDAAGNVVASIVEPRLDDLKTAFAEAGVT